MFSCHGSEAGDERSSVSTLGKSLHKKCVSWCHFMWEMCLQHHDKEASTISVQNHDTNCVL